MNKAYTCLRVLNCLIWNGNDLLLQIQIILSNMKNINNSISNFANIVYKFLNKITFTKEVHFMYVINMALLHFNIHSYNTKEIILVINNYYHYCLFHFPYYINFEKFKLNCFGFNYTNLSICTLLFELFAQGRNLSVNRVVYIHLLRTLPTDIQQLFYEIEPYYYIDNCYQKTSQCSLISLKYSQFSNVNNLSLQRIKR